MSIFRDVFESLVDAFEGVELLSGQALSSTTKEINALPRLHWSTSGWQSTDWQPFVYKVDWKIPAVLTVQGESGDSSPIQEAIANIYDWADQIKGLPHDADNDVVPYGDEQAELDAAGKLFYFGDQFVGPIIESAKVRPGTGDSTIFVADIVVSVSFLVSYEPESTQRVRMVTVGANIGSATGNAIPYDRNQDFSLPSPADADTASWTGFTVPGPALYAGTSPLSPAPYPLQPDVPGVEFDVEAIGQIVIAPPLATVAAAGTVQLQAIGIGLDGSTVNLTGAVAWASGTPAKATVSASGLVTGVATGSSVVTATLGSLVGSSSITVS